MDIVLEALRIERGGRTLLNVPSLRLRGGSTTAILGPNGAGKTTLLRVIAGIEKPDTGKILMGNSPVDTARSGPDRSFFATSASPVPRANHLITDRGSAA